MEVRHRFNNWDEFVRASEGASEMSDPSRNSRERDYSDTDWHYSKTWQDCLELVKEGWQEVRPEVKALTSKIQRDLRPSMIQTFEQKFAVSGSRVSIDRYLSGSPRNMIRNVPVKVAKPGKVITILVNVTYSSGVSTEAIKRRGMAICGLVDALKYLSHSVEIWSEVSVKGYDSRRGREGSTWSMAVCVKKATDQLNMDRVMYALAHPSMLRRTVFSVMECEEAEARSAFSIGGTYGKPIECQFKDEVKPTVLLDLMKYDHGNSTMGADPEGWIKEKLGEFGLLK